MDDDANNVNDSAGFDINFLTNLSIRASANLFYLPETVNY
jgi:hypothetical protein